MFDKIAPKESVEKTIAALERNGFKVVEVKTADEAKKKVVDLLPKDAEVLTMTSVTLDRVGISQEVNELGQYKSVRNELNSLNRETDSRKMQLLGAAPAWAIGSVHAITENGEVVIASNTGSQLPAYAYGAEHVIWVVGTQKIVTDMNTAMKRLNEYVLPLESERAKKAYGAPGSNISKLLVINKEINQGRITIILVNEALGF